MIPMCDGHCRRDVVDAIRYLVKEGICWRAIPADFPPWPTVCDVLDGWQESGATEAMHAGLRRQCRIAAGREPGPSAAIIDSRSVKAAETVAKDSRGIRLTWAGGGYAGKLVTWAKKALKFTLVIVRRPDDLHTFQILPRRRVAGRTLAWITRCRRTVRDYERLTGHHESIVCWAMIITMSRRLARHQQPAQPRAA